MEIDWNAAWLKIFSVLKRHPVFLSLYEAVFVFVFSNFALVFLVFAHVVSTSNEKLSIGVATRVVAGAVSSTEIFVYILALLAPALWVMFYNWRARRHAPVYFTLLVLQAVIIVGSAYIYGKAKFGGIENQPFVDSWAVTCYILGLIIWYVSLIYDKFLSITDVPPRPDSGQSILKELG